ncbi:NADP-dependent oxidoreductase [Nocardia sp. NPDC051911]|uniref:NADP-dependent oxidoreductase n=1 Tax=Nocardia sp. NPDC051911 TaxID=3154648 RepID=UPI00342C478D
MTTVTRTSRAIQLAARPNGLPALPDFRLIEEAVPDPAPGQVLIRNLYLSLDPGMLMQIGGYPEIPMPAFAVGEVMSGGAIGEVVASADQYVPEGALVLHQHGWREYAIADADSVRVVDAQAYPSPSTYLGFGLVAYVGLTVVAGLREGETVLVSSAAGATGTLAGQLARLLGAGRVVGSVGSPRKARYVIDELGFDTAFDYHDQPLSDQFRAAAPEGVDVYFDNVGGAQLRAAIETMNVGGRIALCGALARQRAGGTPDGGPGDLLPVIAKRITLRGFTALDHLDLAPEFGRRLRQWLAEGSLRHAENVVDGLENAPQALLDLVRGRYTGKVVVRLTR